MPTPFSTFITTAHTDGGVCCSTAGAFYLHTGHSFLLGSFVPLKEHDCVFFIPLLHR